MSWWWWENPSLGGTTKNITLQFFKTPLNSKKDKIDLKKIFYFKFYIKRLANCVKFEISIIFRKKLKLVSQMTGEGINFMKIIFQVP